MAKDKRSWLGPSSTEGIPAEAIMNKKGKMVPQSLTAKQEKKRKKFFQQMKEADKADIWRF